MEVLVVREQAEESTAVCHPEGGCALNGDSMQELHVHCRWKENTQQNTYSDSSHEDTCSCGSHEGCVDELDFPGGVHLSSAPESACNTVVIYSSEATTINNELQFSWEADRAW